jgi:condensin complex subunit 1
MIKARGHIAHIAMCLEDEDLRIRDIARLFWAEFSNKQNAIYNVIPDVISNLSNAENVDQAAFQRIMKLLMSYIEKDKQSESLIEKLCHRIHDSKDQSVGKDLVFCMAQLNYTAKCIKKLVENHKCWIMLRTDKEAMAQFDAICNKAKRFAKDDMKTALAQLEAQLAGEKIDDSVENETGEPTEGETPKTKTALKPSQAQNKAKGKAKGKSKAKSKVVLDSEGEDDEAPSMESEGEFEDEVVVKKGKENPKAVKAVKSSRSSRRGVAA